MIKNQCVICRVWRLHLYQLIVTLIAGIIAYLSLGRLAAWSAFIGGMVNILPSMLFAHFVFRHLGATSNRQIVKNFYRGEALKIIFSVMLFAMVFIKLNVLPLVFFLTYIAVQVVHWFSSSMIYQPNRPKSD